MDLIKLEDVTKKYSNQVVLDKINLKVQQGEILAITGNSGKGKSTILNIMGLLEDFDGGILKVYEEINIKPNSIQATKLLRNKISYLFQNFALIEEETVEENLIIALKYIKDSKKNKKEKIKDVLTKVGLAGFEKKYVYQLSGGEQQRVAIARIMLKPCEIVLADEPTGSLDEENRDIVFELLKELNKDGKTIVIVTHDKFISSKCDRVINL